MPPKAKYTRDEILATAFQLVREEGADALTARELAVKLGTSSRPIFTAFDSMGELHTAVIKMCEEMYLNFISEEKSSGKYPEYKAMGMAYIRLAKCEKNVFKLLFMRDRSSEDYDDGRLFSIGSDAVKENLNVEESNAKRLHMEVWIWVHGIASMLATSYIDLPDEVISDMLTDVYSSLKEKYLNE